MDNFRIIRKNNNVEIISKLMDSVAKQWDCRVEYNPAEGTVRFSGDAAYRKYIAEETLSIFQEA